MQTRNDSLALFPCAACGFRVFARAPGSYAMCPVCGWEDDEVQLRFPGSRVGANALGLAGHQRLALVRAPLGTMSHEEYERDPEWRPVREEEALEMGEHPDPGRAYFEAIGEVKRPAYYWIKTDAPAIPPPT